MDLSKCRGAVSNDDFRRRAWLMDLPLAEEYWVYSNGTFEYSGENFDCLSERWAQWRPFGRRSLKRASTDWV